jgi:hypothetical protein
LLDSYAASGLGIFLPILAGAAAIHWVIRKKKLQTDVLRLERVPEQNRTPGENFPDEVAVLNITRYVRT